MASMDLNAVGLFVFVPVLAVSSMRVRSLLFNLGFLPGGAFSAVSSNSLPRRSFFNIWGSGNFYADNAVRSSCKLLSPEDCLLSKNDVFVFDCDGVIW